MNRSLGALAVFAMLTTAVFAQESVNAELPAAPMPVWRADTNVEFGDVIKVGCVLSFPPQSTSARLRLRNGSSTTGGAKGTARFELFDVPGLLEDQKGTIEGVTVAIAGKQSWEALSGNWQAATDTAVARLIILADPDILTVLDSVALGHEIVFSVPTTAGSQSFTFTLEGSFKAVNEFRACLAR